jgi:GGDEF domain-containing protein
MGIRTGTVTEQGQDSGPPDRFGTRPVLIADLTRALQPDGPRIMLALYDIGGFRQYVLDYGRLAGHDLLARVGDRLVEVIDQPASFYGPRYAEFAAITNAPVALDQFLAATARALARGFAEFNLTVAFGAVTLPDEASEPLEALRIANERLSLNTRAPRKRERRSIPRAHLDR